MFRPFPSRSLVVQVLLMVISALIGSATVVVAANTSNAPIFRIGDSTDPARIAAVDANGSLHVSQQGTVTTTIQGTTQVNGSVNVSNFPSDQQIHGTVTANNPGASGVTEMALGTQSGIARGSAAYWQANVAACRSFSVAIMLIGSGVTGQPNDLHVSAVGDPLLLEVDVHTKNGATTVTGSSLWGFPTQPGTNEPFYASVINMSASNGDGATR